VDYHPCRQGDIDWDVGKVNINWYPRLQMLTPTTLNLEDLAMTTEQQIIAIVERLRQFFRTGRTRQYQTRIECLKKLQK
jgi:hypothetical protein